MLVYTCPTCQKKARIQTEVLMDKASNKYAYVYGCGHLEIREKFKLAEDEELINTLNASINFQSLKVNSNLVNSSPSLVPAAVTNPVFSSSPSPDDVQPQFFPPSQSISSEIYQSLDGTKKAYEFQIDGIKFAERANFNCLFADAMGLGKTIEAILTIKKHYPEFIKCLVVLKGATTFQWAREIKEWCNDKPLAVMPITSRECIIPGFDIYLISMDFLARKGVLDKLIQLQFKSIIIDECQSFKDRDSKRTHALYKLITECKIQKRIALSGTPIKNRADEYFTILNLLAPEHFYSPISFQRQWLTQNEKGQYTRINPYRLEQFRELTSRWIIRREKHEVLTNLPPLRRNYMFIEIEDENIKKSYNAQLDLFNNFLKNTAKIDSTQILGWLARLRAITGQAKCQNALDFAMEFLDSTDESLAIGIQHRSVRDTLYYIFEASGYNPLKLSGEDSAYRKDAVANMFNSGANRLLILNMLAGGVGLNLQSCANALVLEREWSSADEEQFESRFHRNGQVKGVTITYMLAKGTIDQWFHEMVANKRSILNETLSEDKLDISQDFAVSTMLRELADATIANRL